MMLEWKNFDFTYVRRKNPSSSCGFDLFLTGEFLVHEDHPDRADSLGRVREFHSQVL